MCAGEPDAARGACSAVSLPRGDAAPTNAIDPGAPRLSGFPPVLDAGCRLLLLGSFPGEASLAAGHYYAHPRNQFWPILAALLDEPLPTLPFEQRYQRLLARGVGLWDVLGACERQGSLDAAIRAPAANDFSRLARLAPALRTVAFNGRTAARFEPEFRRQGYRTAVLPSTSPAYAALRFEVKLQAWRAALSPLPCEDAR